MGFTWQPTQPQNVLVKFHNPCVGCISRVSVEGDAEPVRIEPVTAERKSLYKGLNYLYFPVGLLLSYASEFSRCIKFRGLLQTTKL